MRKRIAAITLLLFFIWILPLGVFIKPSQEKLACDGQRAFCMCHHLLAKQLAKMAGQILLKNGGAPDKESSTAANSHFLPHTGVYTRAAASTALYMDKTALYSLLVPRMAEHVPKDVLILA